MAYSGIWRHMVAYGGIWWHMVAYGGIWWHMVAYGGIFWGTCGGKTHTRKKHSIHIAKGKNVPAK